MRVQLQCLYMCLGSRLGRGRGGDSAKDGGGAAANVGAPLPLCGGTNGVGSLQGGMNAD